MFPSEGAENVFDTDFLLAWKEVYKQSKEVRLPAKCTTCEMSKNYSAACMQLRDEIKNRKEN